MGEVTKDHGGCCKECIRLVNHTMKEKYSNKSLKKLLADDYYYIGLMMGIALLQIANSQQFYSAPEIVTSPREPSINACVSNLQKGLDKLGLFKIIKSKPVLLHLLRLVIST